MAAVKLGSGWGFLNKKGKIEIIPIYKSTGSFRRSLAPVETDRKDDACGYIDDGGKIVIALQFDCARDFERSSRLAPVKMDTRRGYINMSGTVAINTRFEDANPFMQGLAAVKLAGRWGYLDRSGEMRIPVKFVEADDFHDDLTE
ncbi:MAG TPA: WG repeat-containing protein [Spirochaetota bacterium]|nr:WG repeat-containing protein [Spirochaetota bacterium]HNT12751.1 WG repeat-containing protein [Spirochaetota bacterium]